MGDILLPHFGFQHFHITAYLSILADHVHPFYLLMVTSKITFFEHANEFTVLKSTPKSPNHNPTKHPWDVVEWEIRITDV